VKIARGQPNRHFNNQIGQASEQTNSLGISCRNRIRCVSQEICGVSPGSNSLVAAAAIDLGASGRPGICHYGEMLSRLQSVESGPEETETQALKLAVIT